MSWILCSFPAVHGRRADSVPVFFKTRIKSPWQDLFMLQPLIGCLRSSHRLLPVRPPPGGGLAYGYTLPGETPAQAIPPRAQADGNKCLCCVLLVVGKFLPVCPFTRLQLVMDPSFRFPHRPQGLASRFRDFKTQTVG